MLSKNVKFMNKEGDDTWYLDLINNAKKDWYKKGVIRTSKKSVVFTVYVNLTFRKLVSLINLMFSLVFKFTVNVL